MKSSCAIQSSPTPSRRPENGSPSQQPLRLWAVGLTLITASATAHAHGEVGDVLPVEPALNLSLQLAVRALAAPEMLPSTRFDGVLLRGDAGIDPEGLQAEHVAAAAAWRMTPNLGAYAAAGAHNEDPAHVEALWLQWRQDDDAGRVWLATAGRQRLAVGPVLGEQWHTGNYGLPALAHRAAFDHGMADDGIQFGWRGPSGEADFALDAGLWRGRRFPGSEHGGSAKPGLSLRAGATWAAWSADVAWLKVEPKARAANTSPAVGHSHGSPICDPMLRQVICFSGRSQLFGASMRWTGAQSALRLPLTLSLAGWLRHEQGELESANGLADYRGRVGGGWLEADWQWHPAWSAGLRHEALDVHHRLQGSGASLLAREARLQHARPARRETVRLIWQARTWARVGVEGGGEVVSGRRVMFAALRVILNFDQAVASPWPRD